MIKIKICIPYYNEIHPKTLKAANAIREAFPGSKIQKLGGTYIGKARNAMVNEEASQKKFQKIPGNFTHYLFIDADVYADDPVSAVKTMLEAKAKIVGGLYEMRTQKGAYCAGFFAEGRPFGVMGRVKLVGDVPHRDVRGVDWVGAGFLLVEKSVFENVPYPWFVHKTITDDDCSDEVGEDVGFCMSAAKYEYEILAANVGLIHDPWWQVAEPQKNDPYVELNKLEVEFRRYMDAAQVKFMEIMQAYTEHIGRGKR